MQKRFVLVSMIFVVGFLSASAQTSKSDPKDSQGWFTAKLNLDLANGWELSTGYQARYINDMGTYNGSYITFGAEKKLNKFLSVQGDYRLAFVEKGTYHRFSVGGEFKEKASDFEFKLRLLIQDQLQDLVDPTKENQNDVSWRARLQTGYDVSDHLSLYVGTEPIMKFGGTHFVDNWRNTLGAKYEIAKRTKLDLFYIYRPDYAKATYTRYFNIIGFELSHTLKF